MVLFVVGIRFGSSVVNLWAVAPIFLTWMFISFEVFFYLVDWIIPINYIISPSAAFAWKQLSVIKVNYLPFNINTIFPISQSAFLAQLFYHWRLGYFQFHHEHALLGTPASFSRTKTEVSTGSSFRCAITVHTLTIAFMIIIVFGFEPRREHKNSKSNTSKILHGVG